MVSFFSIRPFLDEMQKPMDFSINQEVIEIPLLLTKDHLIILETLSQQEQCTFGEVFRNLLVKAGKAPRNFTQEIVF